MDSNQISNLFDKLENSKLKNMSKEELTKDYNGSKLIHLILLNKKDKLLDYYLENNYDINLVDNNNNTPYHLLLTQLYDIDKFILLVDDNVCWNNENNKNNSIYDLILTNNIIFEKLKNIHDKIMIKKNLDGNDTNYNNICKYLTEKTIIKYAKIIKPHSFSQLIRNINIISISSTISKIIEKTKNNEIIDIKNNMGDNILGQYILYNKNELDNKLIEINKLTKLCINPNYVNPITGTQVIKLLLIYVSDITFLLNYIKNNNIDVNIIDNNGNNLGLFIILLYKKFDRDIDDKLFNYIIKKSDYHHSNLEGLSINRLLNMNHIEELSDTDFNLIEIETSNYTEFRARLDDIIFYFMVLTNKYKNLHIPLFENISAKQIDFDNNMISLPTELPLTLDMLPFFVSFIDENIYYVHPYLNLIINGLKKKYPRDYAIVFLSIQDYQSNLHANILYYDFINLTITRFEPYGDTTIIDNDLDNVLSEELTWNNAFKYIRPSDYINGSGLQSLSDDTNIIYQKPGDFGGFCLAWCLWFVEIKLTNKDISNNKLITKSIKKIIKNHSLVDFIRSYGNKITHEKYEIYKSIKLPENIWSNIVFTENEYKIIFKKITLFL